MIWGAWKHGIVRRTRQLGACFARWIVLTGFGDSYINSRSARTALHRFNQTEPLTAAIVREVAKRDPLGGINGVAKRDTIGGIGMNERMTWEFLKASLFINFLFALAFCFVK